MKLNINKPLVVFDLETTGLDLVNDRIIQISYIKIFPDGKEKRDNIFVNPQKPIPSEVELLTGITNADVASKPTFKEIAQKLKEEFDDSDFAGFNSNHFDIPMLAEEFLRAGIDFDFTSRRLIDAQTIFHRMERRNLSAAYKFYCGRTNDNVDFAGRIIWKDMIDKEGKPVLEKNGKPKRQEVFNFGKHKGKPVVEVLKDDPGYYGWILAGDFTYNTKQVLTRIRLKELAKKAAKSQ